MTRDMTLTVALMLTSLAAAVAAPEIDLGPTPADVVEQAVASPAFERGTLAPLPARAATEGRVTPVRLDGAAPFGVAAVPCALADATAPYRLWHHGAARVAVNCRESRAATTT